MTRFENEIFLSGLSPCYERSIFWFLSHISVAFTPKALHSKAQGQRRSRATLGKKTDNIYPEGVAPPIVCNAFSVKTFY